ncbi:type II toxin-antitoxin system VapB family antitoxin (plasmid) [Thalassobaculum sp. OXR-137]|uniref:type II toxin-antitoxin system VapB family antitoxin n=1 Tax=Thalassobaculum sp. OXR-137 TaxID=3100173 RepID=UPI002AC8F569|nr:type II toxin-antitoxin system VapB family antitoxin [Thalassobaculum sp. OXR-137]WPZ37279.1 type II toxin-antitoxin system VapB family antitoxin [Thalassobaculum sp. OXR-137]
MGIMVDAETEREAHRLAKLRGVTVEQAVSAAVHAELARTERPAEAALTPTQQAKVERTMAMVAALPRLPNDGGDPTAFLYDDRGLPR